MFTCCAVICSSLRPSAKRPLSAWRHRVRNMPTRKRRMKKMMKRRKITTTIRKEMHKRWPSFVSIVQARWKQGGWGGLRGGYLRDFFSISLQILSHFEHPASPILQLFRRACNSLLGVQEKTALIHHLVHYLVFIMLEYSESIWIQIWNFLNHLSE